MVTNARIADLIRESRSEEIVDAIADGSFFKMQTFTQALIDLVVSGEVERELAANAATNRHDFLVALEAAEKDRQVEEEEARAAADGPKPMALGSGLRAASPSDLEPTGRR
jgi:Tfp pilus assembly ATPase PilU